MKWFLYLICLICIAMGCCTIIYTNETRSVLKSILRTIDRKILSALEVLMGILLLFSATASHHSWFIRFIGFMAVIEGGIIFFVPKNMYDELIDWYLNSASDKLYRLFGIITLILGAAILSWIL